MWPLWKRYRRARLLRRPFPDDWEAILRQNVAHYALLAEEERTRLRDDARIFVCEKNWIGCGGLTITDEVRLTIAAQACLLLLHLEHDFFPRVRTILVYPSTFVISGDDPEEEKWAATGQASPWGPVVLAWDSVLADGRSPEAGWNLVVHEFTHHLDFQDGAINGAPDLTDVEQARRWQTVMQAEYLRLARDVRKGRPTLLGEYAATNETEFFSVASERFFTWPARLRHVHPDLYEVLAGYYGSDPLRWFGEQEVEAPLPSDR